MCDISDFTYILNVAACKEHTGSVNQCGLIIYSRLKQFRGNIDTIRTFDKVALDAQSLFHKPLIRKRWEVHISHHNLIALSVVKSRSNAAESGRDIWSNGNFVQLCSNNGSELLPGLGDLSHPYLIPRVRPPSLPHLPKFGHSAHSAIRNRA